MSDILASGAPVTMSSREIAEICDARHNDVVETIERLFDQGVLRESRKTTRAYRPEGSKGGRPTEVYDLTKRDTLVVVSGYNAPVRAKIIDRWMELERGEASAHPQVPTSFREALLLAAEQQETIEAQAKALTIAQPKADALDRISVSDGSYGLYEAAKILQVKPKSFVAFLASHRWVYRRTGSVTWLAYQDRIDNLCLWHKVDTYTDANGDEKTRNTVKVLPKGIVKLAALIPGATIDPSLEGAIRTAAREPKANAAPFARTPEAVS